jgi:hypothetical protein
VCSNYAGARLGGEPVRVEENDPVTPGLQQALLSELPQGSYHDLTRGADGTGQTLLSDRGY